MIPPAPSHPYICQDFLVLLLLDPSETFVVNEEVTEF